MNGKRVRAIEVAVYKQLCEGEKKFPTLREVVKDKRFRAQVRLCKKDVVKTRNKQFPKIRKKK